MQIVEQQANTGSTELPSGGLRWVVDSWLEKGVFHGFGSADLDVATSAERWEKAYAPASLLLLAQHHSKTIISIKRPSNVEELTGLKGDPPAGDSWILDGRDAVSPELAGLRIAIGVRSADCFPVIVRSKKESLVAIAHCGWRGTESGLLLDTLVLMGRLGASPKSLEVAVGPGAQPCCYEIGADVQQLLNRAFAMVQPFSMEPLEPPFVSRDKKIYGNLKALLRSQALFFGVPEKQFVSTEVCTICDQRLFSHRRQGPDSGRQASFIGF